MDYRSENLDSYASSRLNQALSLDDKILILGASGWFGRTLISMLSLSRERVMLVASKPGTINVLGQKYSLSAYDLDEIKRFRPTIVADFAYLTREKVSHFGIQEYKLINQQLGEKLIEVASLPDVQRVIFCSSGAACIPKNEANSSESVDNPYGRLKADFEVKMQEFSETSGKAVLCIRPWSVSGRFVTRPLDYAFSSFIHQAKQGKIVIQSERPVYRRYCAVDDLLSLAVCGVKSLEFGTYHLLESGGELTSLLGLAERISKLSKSKVVIEHHVDDSLEPDSYYSDNDSWLSNSARFDYVAKDLNGQISEVQGAMVQDSDS